MAIFIAIFYLAGNNGHHKFKLTGLEDRRISNIAIYWRITPTLSLFDITRPWDIEYSDKFSEFLRSHLCGVSKWKKKISVGIGRGETT
jgi:hypothetical protein